MNIYYNTKLHDRDELTKRCMIRLIEEGNSDKSIREWLAQGVDYYPLNEFDFSEQCEAAKELFENNEVAYVIYFTDDGFSYIGREFK